MKTLVISFLAFIFFTSVSSAIVDSTLIGWWHFDDSTANDHSGKGHHGTLMNNPRLVPGVNGKGYAYEFQGYGINTDLGSHIVLPMLDFKKMGEFSILLWAKHTGVTHEAGEAYIWFGDHVNGWLGIINHCRQPQYDGILYMQFSVGSDLNFGATHIKPVEILFDMNNVNQWVHYALIYKNGEIKAYINGQFVGSKMQQIDIVGQYAGIARHWWTGNETSTRFIGAIDDVRIYSRALDDDEILNNCDETAFTFEKFNPSSNIQLIQNATIYDSTIILTKADPWVAGSCWYNDKVPVKYGFSTEFSFRFSEGKNKYTVENVPGADGICFVIQNSTFDAVGLAGGSIGYRKIPNSFVVEFDTYKNDNSSIDNFHDPSENHLGVFCNGINQNLSDHGSSACLATVDPILQLIPDGRIFFAKIEYKSGNNLLVYLDTVPEFLLPPILTLNNVVISKLLNLEIGEYAWVGFTSATGNAQEIHEILSWNFCPEPTDAILSVDELNKNKDDESVNIIPNPISDNTTFEINLIENNRVFLTIYNVLGYKISTIIDKVLSEGQHRINWDCRGADSKQLAKGIYFYTIEIGQVIKTGKLIIE